MIVSDKAYRERLVSVAETLRQQFPNLSIRAAGLTLEVTAQGGYEGCIMLAEGKPISRFTSAHMVLARVPDAKVLLRSGLQVCACLDRALELLPRVKVDA